MDRQHSSSASLMLIGAFYLSISTALTAAAALPHSGPRRMLQGTNAAVVANEPKYHLESDDTWLPLCATQASADGGNPLTGDAAAQAAWTRNSGANGEPVSSSAEPFDSCQGQLSNETAQCWTGVDSAVDRYFKTLVCVTPPKCTKHPDGSVTCVGR